MRNILVFVLGLFLIAALFRVDFFFYLLYFFFGIYVLSRVWINAALGRLVVRREYTERAFLGERPSVKLHLNNTGILPLTWLQVRESVPIQLKAPSFFRCVLSLLPYERQTLSYELDCRRRGYYALGPLSISTSDLFGIREQERRLPDVSHVLVYPRIVPLSHLGLPAQTPFGSIASKQRIFEDPSRMVGVRDYQTGDSLRHIHWKTTATTGKLQVKRFEPAISIESQIYLNLNREDYTIARVDAAIELAIVTAASIANYLVDLRQTVGLSLNGQDPTLEEQRAIALPPRRGREQLMHILDVLARVQGATDQPFGDMLRQARLHLTWGGTAIIITPDATDELFDHMLLMKRSGFHVVLVVLDPKSAFAHIEQRAHEVGIKAYLVWQESDLDVWR